MAENSHISWTDHTFNPWIGCTKVSPGCANCYAETLMDHRYHKVEWGKGKPRARTSAHNWNDPLRWERKSTPARRLRVFCASLADWLDDEIPIEWLADLLHVLRKTPSLDWLMLTKRPENWRSRIEAAIATMHNDPLDTGDVMHEWLNGNAPSNIWMGTTVEDQERADERTPILLSIPARVRFLSCEPMTGPVDLTRIVVNPGPRPAPFDALYGWCGGAGAGRSRVHWVITGGESGPGARPADPEWYRSLRDQSVAAGVPFHFKQYGEWDENQKRVGKVAAGHLLDGKEWQQFPEPVAAQ